MIKMKEIYCNDCKQELSEDDKICPNCGSKKKGMMLEIKEKMEHHEWIRGKTKKRCVKKPVQEIFAGDDLHKKSGVWNYKEQNIDRGSDFYNEIVKNKTTGEIIHQDKGLLSEHRGHGSAKYKKKN